MSNSIVSVKNLYYSYDDNVAVNDVSFSLSSGEVLGLLGPNGAGKTTVIRILSGQLEIQKGCVNILGEKFTKNVSKIQDRIGVCFEEKNLYENMTAHENLDFFAKLFGIRNCDTSVLLERVDLLERKNDFVSTYSKGMRQRLMIARSLINNPDILFLDEPTGGLDPASSKAIREIIKEEASNGTTIFLTTHDMTEADHLSDNVAIINEGEIVALDTPENLKVQHGQKSLRVRVRKGEDINTERFELDKKNVGEKIKKLIDSQKLVTMRTEEANLEDVFIKLTGRSLN